MSMFMAILLSSGIAYGIGYKNTGVFILRLLNVLVDPEAFRILLHSGVKITAAPLDTLRSGAVIHKEEIDELKAMNTMLSSFVYSIITSCGVSNINKDEKISDGNEEIITVARIERANKEELSLLDPACAAMIIKPDLFSFVHYYCDVECSGELTTGFTLIDKKNFYGKSDEEKNLWYAEKMNREGFVSLLLSSISQYGGKI